MRVLRMGGLGSRGLRVATSLVVAAGTCVGLQVATAAPAAAVGTVQVVVGPLSAGNSQSPKFAPSAVCPAGTKVLGGGGWAQVQATTPESERVVLSEMRPAPSTTGGRDSYEAGAFELSPGTTADWAVQAFAICAPPIAGMHLVVGRSISSNSTQIARADCGSDNEAVLGLGSQILGADGQATLVYEFAETFRVAQVKALEDADGFGGIWELDAFAVCAPFPRNYGTSFGLSLPTTPNSDPVQVAFSRCGNGNGSKTLGIGAAINVPLPGTGLQVVFPGSQLESAAVEATPTNATWGPTAVQGICGD
ncbi:hypothetical protein [Amycolatopsis sp. RTGN1]|uniref:hypothetical protein n=1 Tax=Amycolatopsis ponsaeliensis TaxID=2992142 RepID=UPI00254CD256|nr:hypothetical protein [Amycolatopsis sp. RTGN1]